MRKTIPLMIIVFIGTLIIFPVISHAAPYGAGKYNENVPYGSQTSLSITTDGNPLIDLTPSTTSVLGTYDNTVTVTSTDVVGYKLYIRSDTTTDMTNGAATIPASDNLTPSSLSPNSWGYNLDGSSNFLGISLSDSLIATRNGPYSAGDNTTVRYGVNVDNATAAGVYTTTVVYTAVPQTD